MGQEENYREGQPLKKNGEKSFTDAIIDISRQSTNLTNLILPHHAVKKRFFNRSRAPCSALACMYISDCLQLNRKI